MTPVQVRFADPLLDRAKKAAATSKLSVPQLITHAVEQYLNTLEVGGSGAASV